MMLWLAKGLDIDDFGFLFYLAIIAISVLGGILKKVLGGKSEPEPTSRSSEPAGREPSPPQRARAPGSPLPHPPIPRDASRRVPARRPDTPRPPTAAQPAGYDAPRPGPLPAGTRGPQRGPRPSRAPVHARRGEDRATELLETIARVKRPPRPASEVAVREPERVSQPPATVGAPSPSETPRPDRSLSDQLRDMLARRDQLRVAFVLREVLGPPLSLRD
jgi:hypothetical protein